MTIFNTCLLIYINQIVYLQIINKSNFTKFLSKICGLYQMILFVFYSFSLIYFLAEHVDFFVTLFICLIVRLFSFLLLSVVLFFVFCLLWGGKGVCFRAEE